MPAQSQLYQEVFDEISAIGTPNHIRVTSLARLALMTTGILAAKSVVISQVAHKLFALGLTDASS